MDINKQKRTVKFNETEKILLLEFIKKDFSIILINNKSGFTLSRKEACWKELAERFNAEDVTRRSVQELKTLLSEFDSTIKEEGEFLRCTLSL